MQYIFGFSKFKHFSECLPFTSLKLHVFICLSIIDVICSVDLLDFAFSTAIVNFEFQICLLGNVTARFHLRGTCTADYVCTESNMKAAARENHNSISVQQELMNFQAMP